MRFIRRGYLYPLTALAGSVLALTLALQPPRLAVGAEINEVQQEFQLMLQMQELERQDVQQRHQRERDAIIDAIHEAAAAQPVDQAAITQLQSELEELQGKQQEENAELQEAHHAAQEDGRLEIQRAQGGPIAAEPDADFATLIEPVIGFTQTDANGIAVGGEAVVAFFGDKMDIDVATGGFEDSSSITGIDIRNSVTGEVYLSLNPAELLAPPIIEPHIEPEVPEVEVGPPAPAPELGLHSINQQAPAGLLEALEADQGEIAISVNGEVALVGTFMNGMAFEALEYLLDASLLPPPLVKDRDFNTLGTLDQLVIKDQTALVQLGKSLFWDVQVGGDNKVSCATCHNFGGADWRTRNQLFDYDTGEGNGIIGNRELTASDFPLSEGTVAGSQGVPHKTFLGIDPPNEDLSSDLPGDFRRVTGRNTPTVINAAFQTFQFWDGRAHRFFNGENPLGPGDKTAGVYVNAGDACYKNTNILIDFSSLASQAVGPPNNATEMSHGPLDGSRSWPELAQKMLHPTVKPLQLQTIHPEDSVLGAIINAETHKIDLSYAELIREAFQDQYWNSPHPIEINRDFEETDASQVEPGAALAENANPFTEDTVNCSQMEANFAFFFGLAIQAYERTLISDNSPFDQFARGEIDLPELEKEGFSRFLSGGTRCNGCHDGPMFSTATFEFQLVAPLEAMRLNNSDGPGMYDAGFYNIGASATDEDVGRARLDLPFGPIALSKQSNIGDVSQWPNLPHLSASDAEAQVDGHFKVSTLRNVELTAPYFHNGRYLTLEDVVEFYARGGDHSDNRHLDPDIRRIGQLDGKPEKIAAVAAWMRTLTDDRVRYRQAPFDHPSIDIPNGSETVDGVEIDIMVSMDATGASGAAEPFPSFSDRLGVTTPEPGELEIDEVAAAERGVEAAEAELAEAQELGDEVEIAEAEAELEAAQAELDAAEAAEEEAVVDPGSLVNSDDINAEIVRSQNAFNAETAAAHSAGLSPEDLNSALQDINARRNARVQQLNQLMQQVNQGQPISVIPAAEDPAAEEPAAEEPATNTVVFTIGGTAGAGEAVQVTNANGDIVAEAFASADGSFRIIQQFAGNDELYPEEGDVLTVTTGGGDTVSFTFGDEVLPSAGALSITEVGTADVDPGLADGIGVSATNLSVGEVVFRPGNRWVIEGSLTDDQGNADKGAQVIAYLVRADGSRDEIGTGVVDSFPAPGGFDIVVRPPTAATNSILGDDVVEVIAITSDGVTTFTVSAVINPEPLPGAEEPVEAVEVEAEPPAGFVEAVSIPALLDTIRNTVASGSVAAPGESAAVPAADLDVAVAAAQIAAANGGGAAGQTLSTTVGEALGDPTRLFFFHEGQVTHADENGVTIMNLLTITLKDQKQHIEGTFGSGVLTDAWVDAGFDESVAQADHPDIPKMIEEGRELSWAELGRVYEANGTNYQEQLARQGEYDPNNRLIGYIIKGTAMLGPNAAIIPATISGLTGPDEPWVEWLIEPRENVLQGVIEVDEDGDLSMAGVKLVESILPGMPIVTEAELQAAVGRTGTIVGHWTPQVPTSVEGTIGRFACREMELDPNNEGLDFQGNVILSYEGPITKVLDDTATIDGVDYTLIEVMDAVIHVPNDMPVPGLFANRAGEEFTGKDFPELGTRVVPVNELGEETYVDTVGSTFAGLAVRGPNREIIMTSMRFVEVAENVMGSNVTWDTSTDGGPTGTGNATAKNLLPLNGSPAANQAALDAVSFGGNVVTGPAEQVISLDPYFKGGFLDVGGEEITISSRPTDTHNMNVGHPSANNVLLLGHYAHPIVGGDGKFHITEGETEYMPAGVNRVIRARGRQDEVSARLDVRGQVKPALASGNEDDGTAVYEAIPATVTLDLGDLGQYSVPVTPNQGLGGLGAGGADQGGLLRGDLGGGFGDIGTYRFTLRFEDGDIAPNIGADAGDPTVLRAAVGITIPAEMTASATGVEDHVVEIDTRVDLGALVDPALDPDFAQGALNDALNVENQARIALNLANANLLNAQQGVVDANNLGAGVDQAVQVLNSAQGAQRAAQTAFDLAVEATAAARDDLAGALAAEAGVPELPAAEEAAAEAAEAAAEAAVEQAAADAEADAQLVVTNAETALAAAEAGGDAEVIANAEVAVANAEVNAATVAQTNAQAAFEAARQARDDAQAFAATIAPAGGDPAAEAQAEADAAQDEFVAAQQELNAANQELEAAQAAVTAADAVAAATPAAVAAEAAAAAAEQAAADAEADLADAELGGNAEVIAAAEQAAAEAEAAAADAALTAAQAALAVATASGDTVAISEAQAEVDAAQGEVDAIAAEAAAAAAAEGGEAETASFTGTADTLAGLPTSASNRSTPDRERLDFVLTDVPRDQFITTGDTLAGTGPIAAETEIPVQGFSITFTNQTGGHVQTFGSDSAVVTAQEIVDADGNVIGTETDVVSVVFSIRDQGLLTDAGGVDLVNGASNAMLVVAHQDELGFTVLSEWSLDGTALADAAQANEVDTAAANGDLAETAASVG